MLPPYTLQVWGIVSFIEIGFATTFKLIFEINSTLSVYIVSPYWSCMVIDLEI